MHLSTFQKTEGTPSINDWHLGACFSSFGGVFYMVSVRNTPNCRKTAHSSWKVAHLSKHSYDRHDWNSYSNRVRGTPQTVVEEGYITTILKNIWNYLFVLCFDLFCFVSVTVKKNFSFFIRGIGAISASIMCYCWVFLWKFHTYIITRSFRRCDKLLHRFNIMPPICLECITHVYYKYMSHFP